MRHVTESTRCWLCCGVGALLDEARMVPYLPVLRPMQRRPHVVGTGCRVRTVVTGIRSISSFPSSAATGNRVCLSSVWVLRTRSAGRGNVRLPHVLLCRQIIWGRSSLSGLLRPHPVQQGNVQPQTPQDDALCNGSTRCRPALPRPHHA